MESSSVEAVVRALNEHRVQYLIVGGLAVVAPGVAATFCALDDLIKLKPLAARPRDLQDIEELRKLRREQNHDRT